MDAGAYGNGGMDRAARPGAGGHSRPCDGGEADLGWYGHRAGSGAPDRHEAQRPGDAAKRPGREAADRLPHPL